MGTSRLKIKYGWKPDLPDHRDFLFKGPAAPIVLPEKVDLRPGCTAVEDQGELGSCTANAIAGAVEFLEKKLGMEYQELSRLFVYYNERRMEGTVNEDSGAMLRSGIKSLVDYGYCEEPEWPYDISKFTVKPGMCCYLKAKHRSISSYHRLLNLNDMLTCLAEGFPFVFGISIYTSFESDEVAKTGVVPMPQPTEYSLGGHAVCAVGYDQTTQRFIVRNSWGPTWGDKGYFTIPYEYVTKLGDDFWVIHK